MFRKVSLAVCVLLIGTSTLGATEVYIGAGFAGEVEGGSFRENLEQFADTDGKAWKLLAGVRIGTYLAIEMTRLDLGDQSCCRGVADLGFRSMVDGVGAAGLGRWPFRRLAPFVKIGVLSWNEEGEFITLIGPSSRSDNGTDLLLGAGLEVDLPAGFGVRAEWERYEFSDASTDSLWASLLFRF